MILILLPLLGSETTAGCHLIKDMVIAFALIVGEKDAKQTSFVFGDRHHHAMNFFTCDDNFLCIKGCNLIQAF